MLSLVLFANNTSGGTGGGGTGGEGTDYIQMPQATRVLTANNFNLETVLANALPGDRIELSPGKYNSLNLTNNTGTQSNPIIICPADKNTLCRFTNETQLLGNGHVHIYGCQFDQDGGTENRLCEVRDANWMVAYCHFKPYGIALSGEIAPAKDFRCHRCLFDPPINTVGSTGKSSFKYGFKPSLDLDMRWEIDWCLFEGPSSQREHVSIKAAGMWMHDCQLNRNGDSSTRDLAVRHGEMALLERIRYDDGDIVCQATDHIIRNCVCNNVILAKGTDDGDITVEGSSSFYLSCKRTTVQQITGNLIIGGPDGVPFSGSQFDTDPRDNSYSDISGSVDDNGINTSIAPSIPAETVPTITPSDVGLSAYRTQVTEAP